MAYGELKVDSITFTDGGTDTTVSVSGLVKNPTFSGDITVTGTISGNVVLGGTTVSGATVTGNAGQFTTLTGTTAGFTTVTGTTVTGDTGEFGTVTGNTAGFTTVTGTTVTGLTVNFVSGVFTSQVSGATVTGTTGEFGTVTGNTAGFTTVTGTTITGTTANFVTVSGTTVTGNTGSFGTVNATGVSLNGPFEQASEAVAALDVDCSTGNYFTKSISSNSTFTFSNIPASGTAYSFTLEVDVTGTSTAITWPASVEWPYGITAPSLTDTKTHLFMFVTNNNGTTWRGAALVNYTT
jgi:hypothetical protein